MKTKIVNFLDEEHKINLLSLYPYIPISLYPYIPIHDTWWSSDRTNEKLKIFILIRPIDIFQFLESQGLYKRV